MMNSWKKILLGTALTLGAAASWASGGGVAWDKAPVNVRDMASLQRGARTFVNYCIGCHSASFMRYNRLVDIGLTEQEIKDQLMFTTDKVGDHMKAAIDPVQAKAWFGANPPDLTVIARSRAGAGGSGADYIYTLLRSYYRDPAKLTGWDNTVFPSIGMPHPLGNLQGERRPVFETHGQEKVFTGRWERVKPGALDEQGYDVLVGDLVNFMQWMGEPAQARRTSIGIWVMLFVAFFTFLAWNLNKAYWKDVT